MTQDQRPPLRALPGPIAVLQPVELRRYDNRLPEMLAAAGRFHDVYQSIVEVYSASDRSEQALQVARNAEQEAWNRIMVAPFQ